MTHRVVSDYTNVESSSNIKVFVRARPPEDGVTDITFIDPTSDEKNRLLIKDPDPNNRKYSEVVFQFDRVFWISTQQQEVFNIVCRPQVNIIMIIYKPYH
jgi:hypothetical protein